MCRENLMMTGHNEYVVYDTPEISVNGNSVTVRLDKVSHPSGQKEMREFIKELPLS